MTKCVKIFLIEDDFIFSRILAVLVDKISQELLAEGIEIKLEAFYSSKEAKFELSQNPHLVLLDYYIMDDELEPETGLPLLKAIKWLNPETIIIIVSGQEDTAIADQLLDEGASYYISKKSDLNIHLYPLLIKTIRNIAANLI